MTLLLTEFHPDCVVFAADRAITDLTRGTRVGEQKKIHEILRLSAGIGFYGLAVIGTARTTDWIAAFLRRRTDLPTLGDVARALATELQAAIPAQHQMNLLGFHLSGYNTEGNPELWHITNRVRRGVRLTGGPRFDVSEDFLREHAREWCGYQGRPGETVRISNKIPIYRNGDLRGHIFASDAIDRIMTSFQDQHDFKPIRDPEEYVKFKMEVIAYIYKKWCRKPLIRRPIDTFKIRPVRRT